MENLPTENPCIRELQKFHDALDREKQFDRDMIGEHGLSRGGGWRSGERDSRAQQSRG